MPAITFFRQSRQDGGTRTGIDIDGDTAFMQFDGSNEDSDPVLSWYVDVICEGGRLPFEPEKAREWLLKNASSIRNGFHELAEKLEAGMDIESWPLRWEPSKRPQGVRISIVCCAVRRAAARNMTAILLELCDHWQEFVHGLPALQEVP